MINREEFRTTVMQLAQDCMHCPLSADVILQAATRFFDEDIPLSTVTRRSLLSPKLLEVVVRTSLSVMLRVMNKKEANRQMLELIDGVTKGHGHDYMDLTFDALLRSVHQLQDDADAAPPVPSPNANNFVAKSVTATRTRKLSAMTTRSGILAHCQPYGYRKSGGLRVVKEEPRPVSTSNTAEASVCSDFDEEQEETDGIAEEHSRSFNGHSSAVHRNSATRKRSYPRSTKDFTGLIEQVCNAETGLERYNCKVASCSFFFGSRTGCQQHICRDHWKIKYRCKLCGLKDNSKANYYRHMRKKHRGAQVDKHVTEIRTQALGPK